MQGDLAIDLRESDGTAGLPVLTPVAVVVEEEVDQLVRTARAGVAMLSLQLRTALNDAAAAELTDDHHDLDHHDLDGARALARVSLDRYLGERRRELAEELEQARAEAAFTVTAARTEAAELVAAASEETRLLLLAGLTPLPADGPPSLRVVPVGDVSVVKGDHPASRDDLETDASTPPAPGAAITAARALAAPSAPPEPELIDLTATPVTSVLVPPPPPPVVAPLSHASTAAAEHRARRGLSRFLYVDVILPMIAVLIVLVVLLAWVG